MRSPTRLQRLVQMIYSSGCELHVLKTGTVAVRKVGGSTEDVSFALRQQVARSQEALWKMIHELDSEEAYEGRAALFHQALEFMDERLTKKHGKRGIDRATKALCRTRVNDPLNDAWNDGDFEEFRAALREYIQTGFRAARGEKMDTLKMEAVG